MNDVIGVQTWRKGRAVMMIEFRQINSGYGMARQFIGADGVLKHSFRDWKTAEGARGEWRNLCDRYDAKGWTRDEGRCPHCTRRYQDVWEMYGRKCTECLRPDLYRGQE